MRKKIIVLILGLIGLFGLSSCDTLMLNTTPVYYDYCPQTIVVRQLPPPPPPRYVHKYVRPHTPPPPKGNHRGRH